MRWPWQQNRALDEQARKERGKLAEAIVRNDRVRSRLTQTTKDGSVSVMLEDLFRQLDEAKRHE